jgi:hypothetical protein
MHLELCILRFRLANNLCSFDAPDSECRSRKTKLFKGMMAKEIN